MDNNCKMKFTSADMRLITTLQGVLSDIEKSTLDAKGKEKLKRYRFQLHDIRVKMISVNQDMHFAF